MFEYLIHKVYLGFLVGLGQLNYAVAIFLDLLILCPVLCLQLTKSTAQLLDLPLQLSDLLCSLHYFVLDLATVKTGKQFPQKHFGLLVLVVVLDILLKPLEQVDVWTEQVHDGLGCRHYLLFDEGSAQGQGLQRVAEVGGVLRVYFGEELFEEVVLGVAFEVLNEEGVRWGRGRWRRISWCGCK